MSIRGERPPWYSSTTLAMRPSSPTGTRAGRSYVHDIHDTRPWGTVLMYAAAVLTVGSMVYYLRKAIPEIRAKAQ